MLLHIGHHLDAVYSLDMFHSLNSPIFHLGSSEQLKLKKSENLGNLNLALQC